MDPTDTEVRALVEEWALGLRIHGCTRCNSSGLVGLPSLRGTCPECGGCGRVAARYETTEVQP